MFMLISKYQCDIDESLRLFYGSNETFRNLYLWYRLAAQSWQDEAELCVWVHVLLSALYRMVLLTEAVLLSLFCCRVVCP